VTDSKSKKQRRAQPARESKVGDEALLAAIEDEWLASRVRGELESSDRLLDESFYGSTSDGTMQTKPEFLRAIQSRGSHFSESGQSERAVRVFGDTAVSTGVVTLISPARNHAFRYLRVFRKSAGEWRLVTAQATRLKKG
jgi:hypothetical protein